MKLSLSNVSSRPKITNLYFTLTIRLILNTYTGWLTETMNQHCRSMNTQEALACLTKLKRYDTQHGPSRINISIDFCREVASFAPARNLSR